MKVIRQLTPEEAAEFIAVGLGLNKGQVKFVVEKYSTDYYDHTYEYRLKCVEVTSND